MKEHKERFSRTGQLLLTSAVILLLNVLQQMRVHCRDIHEQCLDRTVICNAPSSTRIGFHSVNKNLHLHLQGCYKLLHLCICLSILMTMLLIQQKTCFQVSKSKGTIKTCIFDYNFKIIYQNIFTIVSCCEISQFT